MTNGQRKTSAGKRAKGNARKEAGKTTQAEKNARKEADKTKRTKENVQKETGKTKRTKENVQKETNKGEGTKKNKQPESTNGNSRATTNPTHWSVYLVRCRDGSLYTGITTDVERRFAEHQQVADNTDLTAAKGAKALRGKGPLTLVFTHAVTDRSVASKLEYRIKQLKKTDKEKLVVGSISIDDLEPQQATTSE